MRYISCKLDDLRKIVLPIGYEGENDHTRVQVDAGEVFREYPAAVPSLKVQGPGGSVYPAEVTRDGRNVIWDIKASDCATDGSGEAQFTFTNNSVIVKSCIAKIKVHRSITGGTTPPDPVQDWLDNAEDVLEDLEAAEVHQPMIGVDGYWYTWNQETGEYEKTETKAQGEDGQQGPAGQDGAPGQDATPALITVNYADLTFPVEEGTNCYHDGLLYYAKQAIQSSEAWTAAHWQQTTVEEQQRLLKNAIHGTEENVYGKSYNIFTRSGFVDLNGQLQYHASWVTTEYIDADLYFRAYVWVNGIVSSIAFYNENKTFISGITVDDIAMKLLDSEKPSGTKFFTVTTHIDHTDSYVEFKPVSQGVYYAETKEIKDELTEIAEDITGKHYDVFTRLGFINLSGQLQVHSSWRTTDYISIDLYHSAYVMANAIVASVAFYDSNKRFISCLSIDGITMTLFDGKAPLKAEYFTASTLANKPESYVEYIPNNSNTIREIISDIKKTASGQFISVFHDSFHTQNTKWYEINGTDNWIFDTTNYTLTPVDEGGYVSNALTNVIGLNLAFASDMRIARFVVTLYSDTVMNIHLFRSNTTGGYPNESMYIIDCASGKLRMCKNNNRYVVTNEYVASGDFTVTNGKKYIVEIGKIEQCYYLEMMEYGSGLTVGRVEINDSWAGGSLIGKYGLSLGDGTPFVVHDVDISILNNPKICVVGDSVTEGTGAMSPSHGFANLIRDYVDSVVISAEASDTWSDVIDRFSSEYSIIKPEVLFVTIGINDTSITSNMIETLVGLCEDNNIKLILNHIPANSQQATMTLAEKNAMIDSAETQSVKFDLVSHVNNDPTGSINTSLFPDGVHPNNNGALAMLARIPIDAKLW